MIQRLLKREFRERERAIMQNLQLMYCPAALLAAREMEGVQKIPAGGAEVDALGSDRDAGGVGKTRCLDDGG